MNLAASAAPGFNVIWTVPFLLGVVAGFVVATWLHKR